MFTTVIVSLSWICICMKGKSDGHFWNLWSLLLNSSLVCLCKFTHLELCSLLRYFVERNDRIAGNLSSFLSYIRYLISIYSSFSFTEHRQQWISWFICLLNVYLLSLEVLSYFLMVYIKYAINFTFHPLVTLTYSSYVILTTFYQNDDQILAPNAEVVECIEF